MVLGRSAGRALDLERFPRVHIHGHADHAATKIVDVPGVDTSGIIERPAMDLAKEAAPMPPSLLGAAVERN